MVRVGGVVSEVGPAAAAVGAAKRCHGPSAVARLCLPVRHVVLPGWIHQLNSLVVFVLRCVCVCVCVCVGGGAVNLPCPLIDDIWYGRSSFSPYIPLISSLSSLSSLIRVLRSMAWVASLRCYPYRYVTSAARDCWRPRRAEGLRRVDAAFSAATVRVVGIGAFGTLAGRVRAEQGGPREKRSW